MQTRAESPAARQKLSTAALDLDAYLARIGYDGSLEPTPETLSALHLAHISRIPFSTIEALIAPPLPLDLKRIQQKLVHDRQGGYCVEQNLMFATVLEALGFSVTMLAAKVRSGSPDPRPRPVPRPHLLLSVSFGDRSFLADVGFGGDGLMLPLPFAVGEPADQFGWQFRLVAEEHEYVLQNRQQDQWSDLYSFSLLPQSPTDLVLMHHFCSTHPKSALLNIFWTQRAEDGVRWTFWMDWATESGEGLLVRQGPEGEPERTRVPRDEQAAVLAEKLSLHLPPGALLPVEPIMYRVTGPVANYAAGV
ncbi:arylamine N-acetyltransferase family protein [Actinophytocola oryzae]|uniref:N-hydroxyarylamine O-acetyltransferase n=1 Tax=Actinophytocola oryzae TaxID=502181 RepID=A0A4R7VRD8_9PSEU|nr:arylamine N-acetyltransferase [Actinophytocola oryzae]TDV52025.1 N-hydroxyarylamine O-acetyltransferase [Actinophytocola oryzae]